MTENTGIPTDLLGGSMLRHMYDEQAKVAANAPSKQDKRMLISSKKRMDMAREIEQESSLATILRFLDAEIKRLTPLVASTFKSGADVEVHRIKLGCYMEIKTLIDGFVESGKIEIQKELEEEKAAENENTD